MKSNRHIIPAVFVTLSSILLSGCLEYKIVTQIMEDGSIHRTVTIMGDSAQIFEKAYPQYDDPEWVVSMRHENRDGNEPGGEEVFVFEATRTFSDVQSMNDEIYFSDPHGSQLNAKASFQKHFKWFYSMYEYTETYLMRFPFNSRSVFEFLTESELRVYNAEDDDIYYDPLRDSLDVMSDDSTPPQLTGQDSLRLAGLKEQIEERFEDWAKLNLYDAFYLELESALASTNFTPVAGKGKEELYQWLDSTMVFEDVLEERNVLVEAASRYYGLDSSSIYAANKTGFDGYNSSLERLELDLDAFTHQVLMPGLVVSTNAGESDGNLVAWNFTTNDFYATDYTMTVRTRAINRWMIVVSSALIFVVIGLLIASLLVKKRK